MSTPATNPPQAGTGVIDETRLRQELENLHNIVATERAWAATLAVAPTLTRIYSHQQPALEPGKFTVALDGQAWATTAVNLGQMIADAYEAHQIARQNAKEAPPEAADCPTCGRAMDNGICANASCNL